MKAPLAAMAACLLLFSCNAAARARPIVSGTLRFPESDTELIYSRITFDRAGKATVHFASIADPDPLTTCPIEEMPADIMIAVDQLVLKSSDIISKIKESRGPGCSKLQDRMNLTAAQLGTAMQNQFIAVRSIASTADQNLINAQTRQASAINALVMTASDLFQRECITRIEDMVLIQKLIGQVIMLSGLFLGGWQGLSIAAGGQLLGNIPIFRDDVDRALEIIQAYEERGQRAEFLCLFRQMLKLAVLLFANEDSTVVSGLDLTFKTGAVKTTMDTLADMEKRVPHLYADAEMLQQIFIDTEEIVPELVRPKDKRIATSFELLDRLKVWCAPLKINGLKATAQHHPLFEEHVALALLSLNTTCKSLNTLSYSARDETQIDELLLGVYWDLTTVRGYYEKARDELLPEDDGVIEEKSIGAKDEEHVPDFGEVVRAIESRQYFQSLKRSMVQYQEPSGNQARLNYQALISGFAKGLATKSFKSMMTYSHKILVKKTLFGRKHMHGIEVRQRALRSMLDLCQTFDPTLTRLHIDSPERNPLQKQWLAHCVGPRSYVCRDVFGKPDELKLVSHPRYLAYFYSLCGR